MIQPIGRAATLGELEQDPHPLLARLRGSEPVSWLPALDGWLVSRYDIAVRVLHDPAGFTVDDPRFSTAAVLGPSMLSLDGAEHERHRAPFAHAFRPAQVRERFAAFIEAQADRLISAIQSAGRVELRREFAGPLTAAVITEVLGMADVGVETVLSWYAAIVPAVADLSAGRPAVSVADVLSGLRSAVLRTIDGTGRPSLLAEVARAADGLSPDELVSNAAVLLFGGVDTTEGMILNAVRHLVAEPEVHAAVRGEDDLLSNAIEESLRLEPTVALVDRYATGDVELGGVRVRCGDRVSVSIAAANRDPAVFNDPDRFDVRRADARLNLAFAQGPHVCPAAQLATAETHIAVGRLLDRLPGLRLEPDRPNAPRGLVFRKPPALHLRWGPAS